MTKDKALELALEALECANSPNGDYENEITVIKEALAQPPLTENGMYRLGYHNGYGFGEAYGKANAPQRTWVGLKNEEIKAFDAWHDNRKEEIGWCNPSEIVAYIEAKLKEKNT
jgi:hypothetical protein